MQYPRKVPSGVLMILMSTEEGMEEKRESEEYGEVIPLT